MSRALAAGVGIVAVALAPAAFGATSSAPIASAKVSGAEPMTLYRTRAGDTLEGLAVHYLSGRGDVATVARLNAIANPNRIPIGTSLLIPTRLLKSTPTTLTAIAVSGPVLRAGATGAAAPLAKGDLVREGDQISTGANAFATLTQPNGSRVTLPSHTTLRVAVLRHILLEDAADTSLVIESGHGQMTVTPLRQASDRFEIRSPAAVAAVRGTEFRVDYDAERSVSTLEVLHGRVAESASETSPAADIVTGQAAQRPLGGERRILPLQAAPALAQADPRETYDGVVLRIAEPHPGWRYHFVLTHDPEFTDVFAESTTADGVARFESPPPGLFYAEVTAIDENGVEGLVKRYTMKRLEGPQSSAGG